MLSSGCPLISPWEGFGCDPLSRGSSIFSLLQGKDAFPKALGWLASLLGN